MSPNDEPHLPQPCTKIPRVERESSQTFPSFGSVQEGGREVEPGWESCCWSWTVDWVGGERTGEGEVGGGGGVGGGGVGVGRERNGERRSDTHDGTEGGDDLGEDGGRDGFRVDGGVRPESESVDGGFVGRDVT